MAEEVQSILRLTTAGSVDDGKSTLIGRLLYDTKSIRKDQMEQLGAMSRSKGLSEIDLAFITDGLKDEQDQGITIDVAYRYFSTKKRKFIIADSPGHTQYTRNMVTGASTAQLALTLIDARKGLTQQSKRHIVIASLLRLHHLVVCVNKMDLVSWSEERFEEIRNEVENFTAKLLIQDIRFIPISALKGDNVVWKSENMTWYEGPGLLHTLEEVHVASDQNLIDLRFPVQTVIRPKTEEYHDFRGYAGRVESGIIKAGDEVIVLPHKLTTRVKAVHSGGELVEEAFPPMSVAVSLEDEIDISRGDMLVRPNNQPLITKDIDALICWFSSESPSPRTKYILRQGSKESQAVIREVLYTLDIDDLHRQKKEMIESNDIFRARLRTADELFIDDFDKNKGTGSFIIIDPRSNQTIGAGVLRV